MLNNQRIITAITAITAIIQYYPKNSAPPTINVHPHHARIRIRIHEL